MIIERKRKKSGDTKLKDVHMGGNNAMSFSKIDECYLPLEMKS